MPHPSTPPLPPGWRGIARLALDALIAGVIASGVLTLAALAAVSRAEAAPVGGAASALVLAGADGIAELNAPLVATEVDIRVAGIVARARVTQHFINPTAQWREALYMFPLPERAAVDRLHMQVGDRVIEGEIHEKAAARAIYAKARAEGTKASLIEQMRPNLFTASVAHLGPGESVAVTIEYQETLRYDHGSFALRFPLAMTPRYSPSSAHSDADMAAPLDEDVAAPLDEPVANPPMLAADEPPTNPVSMHVSVDSGFALQSITSASHRIDIREDAGHSYDVTLADDIVASDRDFELAWTPDVGAMPGAALFTESRDGRTWALLMVLPPSQPATAPIAPREATFVIDTSGSMSGASITQARQAVLFALDRLKPGDRFNVIEFNSTSRSLFGAPMPVDAATLAKARTFVNGLKANGGTEMTPALEAALDAPATEGLVQQVVFLTDGAVDNERDLVKLIAERARTRHVFTVGIGAGPNTWFLRKAAEAGRGTATFIGDVHDVKARMTELYAKLESPALTAIDATWSAPADRYPKALPDLYLGEPVVMTAQFATSAVSMSLTARRGDEAWGLMLPLSAGTPADGIATLWARDRIEALSDAIQGDNLDAIRPQIVATALEHHLVSRFTSLVAVDVTPTLPSGMRSEPTLMPVNLPAGYDVAQAGLPQTATPATLLFTCGLASLLLAMLARWASRRRAVQGGVASLDDHVRAARSCC